MGAKTQAAVAAACVAAVALAVVVARGGDVEEPRREPTAAVARADGPAGGSELESVEPGAGRASVEPASPAAAADAGAAPLVIRGRVVDAACEELAIAESPAADARV